MSNLEILNKHNFKFNKAYGQNFIFDKNFLRSIIEKSDIAGHDVLEIGPGAGSLTSIICESAKKVVAYEIDKNLKWGITTKYFDYFPSEIMEFNVITFKVLKKSWVKDPDKF